MYYELDKSIKEETIVLSHLQRELSHKSGFSSEFLFEISSEFQPEKEEKKEEKEGMEQLSKENLKYYKIENEKKNELEKYFRNSKTKIQSENIHYLGKGKFWQISKGLFVILDKTYFNKLYEIKLKNIEDMVFVIELDNNDLIFMYSIRPEFSWTYHYELLVYRLKNNNYFLFQKIKEDRAGYKILKLDSWSESFSKSFELDSIKKLSDNRFMSISNYGIKIYALNSNKNYTIVLLDKHENGIKNIYEIDENNFIFCTSIYIDTSLDIPAHNYLMIEKVCLKNISTEEIISKQKDLENEDLDLDLDYNYEEEIDKIDKNESEKIISSLKLISNFQLLMQYSTYSESHYFSDFVVLKKKYFLIMIDHILLIFDLSTGKQLIRYLIFDKEKTNSDYDKLFYEIGKWNENEFFIYIDGNITLFHLDDSHEINLKIIAYSFFPNLSNLIKMDDENRFYSQEKDQILIF